MLHAAFLRSEIAAATITQHRHVGRGAGLPGVVAVYTWEDFDGSLRAGVARDAR